jgi:hypothetical protein
MTTDEIAMREAERWFRSKLRRESPLSEFEHRLFSAHAERQAARADAYTPKERPPEDPSPLALRIVEPLATTRPPPADIQQELLRLSRADSGSHGREPARRK